MRLHKKQLISTHISCSPTQQLLSELPWQLFRQNVFQNNSIKVFIQSFPKSSRTIHDICVEPNDLPNVNLVLKSYNS